MSNHDKRRLKRKIEECHDDENDEGRAAKEAKGDATFENTPAYANGLNLLRLLPEDWASTGAPNDVDEETSVEESTEGGSVSRGTLWKGKDVGQNSSLSQVSLVCERFPNGPDFDCETQTYYFVPKTASDAVEGSDTSHSNIENKKDHDNPVQVCCVEGCGSQSDESDPSTTFYCLPSSASERFLWAEILGVVFSDITANTSQEICCKHFITPKTMPCDSPKTPLPSRIPQVPKSKTRKKRTCDILIAEEAERVKQSMVTGRSKRTPKPNRNYDWAELIPLIKSEADDELFEMPAPKVPAKHSSAPGRRRKQLLDDIKREEKENEVPVINLHADFVDENGMADLENNDYGADISLPSIPRQPPPKSKGRPHRIRDTCTQTDGGLCASREPLREVKVQCNLTAEPLVCCSSCSSIDWMSLEEELTNCISLVEGDLCNPVLVKCLKKVLDDVTKPSYASNALKILSGIEKDVLESCKDIVLVSSQDEFDEVEIENVIHQEEAPITGVREITPKLWSKKASKVEKQIGVKIEDIGAHDTDSFGLKEATEKDDEEFHPEYSALEEDEEEEDDDLEEIDDDDDWDIKKEDECGVPITKKKKPRRRLKKEHMLEAGSGQGSSSSSKKEEEVISIANPSSKPSIQQNRRRRRTDDDKRWLRQEHKCSDCNKVFSTKRKFDLHFSHVHLGVPPWQGIHHCDDCGKNFTQKVSLNVHRMFKHGVPRRYHCGKCTYEGPTKEYLKRHLKVHTRERQYVCQECGKGLKTASSYRNHLVIHTNVGRFFCDMCKKAFNHRAAFRDHMKSHQEERDYACNYCGASFKAYKHVARHIRAVHLNDKRFICDICGTQHMTGFNLKNHLKKHGDVPFLPYSYQCPACQAKFRGFQGLSSHLRVVHNTKPEAGNEEVMEKPMVTPHPTRRPIKYHYSLISASMASEDSPEDPKPAKGPETILVDYEDIVVCELKNEELHSVCEESGKSRLQLDNDFLISDNEGGERVINIFSCTQCSSIFTSETSYQKHITEIHSNYISLVHD